MRRAKEKPRRFWKSQESKSLILGEDSCQAVCQVDWGGEIPPGVAVSAKTLDLLSCLLLWPHVVTQHIHSFASFPEAVVKAT